MTCVPAESKLRTNACSTSVGARAQRYEALSRNLDLQIEHLSADIARNNLSSAYQPYEPTFSFGARHEYFSDSGGPDFKKLNPYLPYELNTDTAGPALSGQLPIGLSYDLSALAREYDGRTDLRSDPGAAAGFPGGIRQTNQFIAEAGLEVRQRLLKDFWIDQDRERIVIRRKELKLSQQALRFQIMKTVLGVELGYYDVVSARERVRVEEKALELKQQLVAETQRRVQVGDLPPLDREQVETQLQNTQTALAGAREASSEQQNALKNLFSDNFKEWAEVEVQPADALLAMPEEANRSERFMRALQNRPDLEEARLAVEKSAVSVQFRLNQLFPSLDFVGRYGGRGSQPEFGAAASDAVHFRFKDYFYGVVLSFPLSNAAERGNFRTSKASKQIAELQLKKAEREVLLQVADFVNRTQSRFSQVGSTRPR